MILLNSLRPDYLDFFLGVPCNTHSRQKLITTITQIDHRIAQRREAQIQQLREERKKDHAHLGQGEQREPRPQQTVMGHAAQTTFTANTIPTCGTFPTYTLQTWRTEKWTETWKQLWEWKWKRREEGEKSELPQLLGVWSLELPHVLTLKPHNRSQRQLHHRLHLLLLRARISAAVLQQSVHYEDHIGIMEEHEYPVAAVQA